jgi:hypothetical protein
MCPSREEALKEKGKRLTMLRVVIKVRKTHSKNTTLHPKLQTSISGNLGPKIKHQKVQEQLPLLPRLLNKMYQKLLSIGHVALEPLAPLQQPYPNWYKPNLTCEYHTGAARHSIHTCSAFKKKLMQLIKTGWVMFKETLKVSVNPLPNHASSNGLVNALEEECLGNLKALMIRVGCEEDNMNFLGT